MPKMNAEQLEKIKSDWFNEECISNDDVNRLIEQSELFETADTLIYKLHRLLGTSANLDFALWKETESYVKEREKVE